MLSFFPRDVLDEILNLIASVSGDFPTYTTYTFNHVDYGMRINVYIDIKKRENLSLNI